MSRPTISAGTTFSVSKALPATDDRAGFEAISYTQARGVRSVGEVGKQWQTVTRNPLGSKLSYQQRVGYSSGNLQLELIRIADDGQDMLRAAIDANTSYSYRIKRPDESCVYFTAQAVTRKQGGFNPSSIADTAVTLEIDSEIIEPD